MKLVPRQSNSNRVDLTIREKQFKLLHNSQKNRKYFKEIGKFSCRN